jgi:hypothetical protein
MLFAAQVCAILLLSAATAVAGYNAASTAETDKLAITALGKLSEYYAAQKDHGTCTIKTAAVRREW